MDIEMKLKKFGTLSPEHIKNIEKILTLELPEDYKHFLVKTNGGIVEKDESNKIHIDDLNADIAIDVLYGGNIRERNANISYWMEQLSDDLFEDTIIIGDDILQGLIVMICREENKGIYYWDDAYNFENSSDDNNIYWISETFKEFLQLLH